MVQTTEKKTDVSDEHGGNKKHASYSASLRTLAVGTDKANKTMILAPELAMDSTCTE